MENRESWGSGGWGGGGCRGGEGETQLQVIEGWGVGGGRDSYRSQRGGVGGGGGKGESYRSRGGGGGVKLRVTEGSRGRRQGRQKVAAKKQ